MSYINLILGKKERQRVSSVPSFTAVSRWEGDVSTHDKLVTHWANAKIFSNRTERDETQVVGKLYEGRVDG